jgi:hypothetical protein
MSSDPAIHWSRDSALPMKFARLVLVPMLDHLRRRFGLGSCTAQLLFLDEHGWSISLSAVVREKTRHAVVLLGGVPEGKSARMVWGSG